MYEIKRSLKYIMIFKFLLQKDKNNDFDKKHNNVGYYLV
jgi:hypothetical protein